VPDLLIVDDLPELRELLEEAFTDQNFTVSTAANAIEARRFLAERRFDLVLVDAVMPGEQGASLAEFAQSIGIPVIVMTGHIGLLEDDQPPWPRLAKPFRIDQAIGLVRQVLAARRIDVHDVNTL
jgi:DNA-binding NtrC family response regulator